MAAVLLFRAQMAAVTSCEDDPLVGQKNRATFLHQSIIFAIFMIKADKHDILMTKDRQK